MSTISKIVVSLALVLGMASAATAATKHPVHHQRAAVQRQVPASAYQSYGLGGGRRVSEPAYMGIQDRDEATSNGF